GTIVVALTADDQARLQHHLVFQHKLGLPLEWITAAETRRCEPHLADKLAGAVWSPQDHQVENRKLAPALRQAAERAGAIVREHTPVKEISVTGGRADGITREEGGKVAADAVVLAAGAWSRSIGGVPPEQRPPVRPIKGQMIALRMDPSAPLINHVVWSPGLYLVPRRDGRLILGATVEEKAFDTRLTAGGVLALLDAAWRTIPSIEELPIDEMWVGHRPGSRPDPGARSARRARLRARPSSQRHPARAGHRRRDHASCPRWHGRARDPAVRGRALCAGARSGIGSAMTQAHIRINGQDEI